MNWSGNCSNKCVTLFRLLFVRKIKDSCPPSLPPNTHFSVKHHSLWFINLNPIKIFCSCNMLKTWKGYFAGHCPCLRSYLMVIMAVSSKSRRLWQTEMIPGEEKLTARPSVSQKSNSAADRGFFSSTHTLLKAVWGNYGSDCSVKWLLLQKYVTSLAAVNEVVSELKEAICRNYREGASNRLLCMSQFSSCPAKL